MRISSTPFSRLLRIKGFAACHAGKIIETDGVVKTFHDNGRIKQEMLFRNGIPEGIHKTFRKDGTIETVEKFKNGHLIWVQDFNIVGQKESETHYKNRQPIKYIRFEWKTGKKTEEFKAAELETYIRTWPHRFKHLLRD